MAIHKDCHYLPKVPAGSWYCDRCAFERAAPRGKRLERACQFCPSTKGAFKRTHQDQWGGWAHMVCAQFHSATGFVDHDKLNRAAGFDHECLAPFRKLKCSLCTTPESRGLGLKVQCSYPKCAVAFHPTCALEAGFCVKGAGEANRHGIVDESRCAPPDAPSAHHPRAPPVPSRARALSRAHAVPLPPPG